MPIVLAVNSGLDKNIHYEIVWFAGRPIAQVTPGGQPLYTFTDHLGTPILQTDSVGAVTWRAEYEPFGNVWEMRIGTRTEQPLRFPGQEVAMNWEGQEENYNIHRWYRSGWGRYTQDDPIGADKYAYANDDPVGTTDPLGLYAVKNVIKEIATTNIAKLCGSLGSACTKRVYKLLSGACSCGNDVYYPVPTLNIGGPMYYYTGNPKFLKTTPVDPTVISPETSIQYEWSCISIPLLAVDASIKELEQKTFQSKYDGDQACGSYRSGWRIHLTRT